MNNRISFPSPGALKALGCRNKVKESGQGALKAAPSNLKPHSSVQTQENSEVGLMVCRAVYFTTKRLHEQYRVSFGHYRCL